MSMETVLRNRGGLLANEGYRARTRVFIVLLIVATSMTFLQLGFVGLGTGDHYVSYLITLLGPISVSALLLGWKPGTLMGLACGTVLLAHSFLMPLDHIEAYLICPQNSVLLYAGAGLILGLLFDVIMQWELTGIRKYVAIAVVCVIVAVLSTTLLNLTLDQGSATHDQLKSYVYSGSSLVQTTGDALLMIASCVVTDLFTHLYYNTKNYVSMRTIFRWNLIIALVIAYLMATSVGFVVITAQQKDAAYDRMGTELAFITNQLNDRWSAIEYLSSCVENEELTSGDLDVLINKIGVQNLADDYDIMDGTIVVIVDNKILFSNNILLKSGENVSNKLDMEAVTRAAKEGTMEGVLYDDGNSHLQLGYLRAMETGDDAYVTMAIPFSRAFVLRQELVIWTSLITLTLLVMAYVMVARLLRKVVMDPINGTNRSLHKIMKGDLNELVREVASVEFASLSAGINATVDALKSWITEAKRLLEGELTTARAIQEGALPHQFPAFPDVECVDLYAFMDAARDVGGDFYDFFTIDDHTICFLIADVSGKGIPGALFMMAAKTEIQNHLSSGVEPAQAIANANAYLCDHNEAGMFVTVWAATLDWKKGLLTYVNAGHNFPLLRHGRGGTWEWLDQKSGLFLGTFPTAQYHQKTLSLHRGDELVLYTDGVNEAFNVSEEEYGNARLEAFLCEHADERPRDLVQALRADVGAWATGAEQSDDITILAVEYDA